MSLPNDQGLVDHPADADQHHDASSSTASRQCNMDSPNRTYAIIESDPHELDHIIDIFRQFFPKTRIVECHNQTRGTSQASQPRQTSMETISSIHTSLSSKSSFDNEINNDLSPCAHTQTFRGKVKDYLQRRYLGQIDEYQARKDLFARHSRGGGHIQDSPAVRSSDPPVLSLAHSRSDTHLVFDRERATSRRGFLQRTATIDIEDQPSSHEHTIETRHRLDSDPIHDDKSTREKRPYRHSHSEQTATSLYQHLQPNRYSFEHDEPSAYSMANRLSLPLTPYSASSDPGPYHSPWFNTSLGPSSLTHFQFPQRREPSMEHASTFFSEESNARLKLETHPPGLSQDASSLSTCPICRQQFDSHSKYLEHHRSHLEASSDHHLTGTFDVDADRPNNLRHYSCRVCLKRFARSDMLNRHLRLHSGVRPYHCALCNTHFARSDHLSTHLRTHTGEKPYTCPYCTYTACRRDMITRHIRIHTKESSERKNATSAYQSDS